jgi:hypothetical protein
MMKLLPKLILAAVCIPALVPAGDFNGLVREFSRQTGAHQTRIPFLGLARFVVATAHPAGTSEFKLAVFENVDGRQRDFIDTADGVASGEGWNRIVSVRSKNGESTNIYMLPEGKRLRMLVTTVDSGDAVFAEMRIKPENLVKFLDDHDSKRKLF